MGGNGEDNRILRCSRAADLSDRPSGISPHCNSNRIKKVINILFSILSRSDVSYADSTR